MPQKKLDQLVSATVAKQIAKEIRTTTEDLFEAPQRGSSLEEIRDNLWEMYLSGSLESDHPRNVVAAARVVYFEIFEEIASARGFGKDGELRKRFNYRLARTLSEDVAGYKKIDPDTYIPTREDLAKFTTFTLAPSEAVLDLATQLTGLEELEFYGDEREPGLAKQLAAAVPAPKLRRLTLNSTPLGALEGALENAAWTKLDYLAIYECNFTRALVTKALAHWSGLTTFALRGSKVGTATLDVIATSAPRLEELALVDAQVSDAAIEGLLLTRPWPALQRVFLSGNAISAESLKKLRAKLPKAKVKT